MRRRSLFALLLGVLFSGVLCVGPAQAQPDSFRDALFVKAGAGFSDYTGDFPAGVTSHPFDFQEFSTGNGAPVLFTGEVGYQYTPKLAFVLGFQGGNFPISGFGGPTIEDSYRYTPHALARYTFGDPERTISPYVDGGLNLTVGGDNPPTSAGFGPSIGGGVNITLNESTSFFVESRFHLTLPDDAIDGSNTSPNDPAPFDMANQLLGVGVKINLGGGSQESAPDPPTEETVASAPSEEANAEPPRAEALPRYEGMTQVTSGSFIMGLTDEDPLSLQNSGRKRVTVSAFYVDTYEVTNAEYRAFLAELSDDERDEFLPDSTAWEDARTSESWDAYFRSDFYADYPVVAVSWRQAQAYCQAQNKRLPTEAEWEYAARAGHIGRVYPWEGLDVRNDNGAFLANYKPEGGYAADGYAFTAPVDAFPPNDWGIYNMAGNVSEWTFDTYTPSYEALSDFNPRYQDEESSRRVVRGGAWNSSAFFIGVGVRDAHPAEEASASIGFRCAREIASPTRPGGTTEAPAEPDDGDDVDNDANE